MGASEVPLKFSVHKMIVDVIVGEMLIDPLEEQSLTSAMKLFTKSVVEVPISVISIVYLIDLRIT